VQVEELRLLVIVFLNDSGAVEFNGFEPGHLGPRAFGDSLDAWTWRHPRTSANSTLTRSCNLNRSLDGPSTLAVPTISPVCTFTKRRCHAYACARTLKNRPPQSKDAPSSFPTLTAEVGSRSAFVAWRLCSASTLSIAPRSTTRMSGTSLRSTDTVSRIASPTGEPPPDRSLKGMTATICAGLPCATAGGLLSRLSAEGLHSGSDGCWFAGPCSLPGWGVFRPTTRPKKDNGENECPHHLFQSATNL